MNSPNTLNPSTINQEPQLKSPEVLQPLNQAVQVSDSLSLTLYDLPENPEAADHVSRERVGTNNPEVLARLMNGGISALEDGESVSFAQVNSLYDNAEEHTSALEALNVVTVQREGERIAIVVTRELGDHPRVATEDQDQTPLEIDDASKRLGELFSAGITDIRGGKPNLELAGKGRQLAETEKALGFNITDESDPSVPLPRSLQENIARLQEAGLPIPNIRFFREGHISSQDYVQTWSEGELPASEQPGYFNHDLLQEHFRPLIIARDRGIKLGQLYAKTVLESDQVVAEDFIDQYQVNSPEPITGESVLTDEERLDWAAMCLDQYTNELANLLEFINYDENDPRILDYAFSEKVPHGMRFIPQMLRAVISSPHKQELVSLLEEMGSSAYDQQSETIDYETFVRELFRDAQNFWEVPIAETQTDHGADREPESAYAGEL